MERIAMRTSQRFAFLKASQTLFAVVFMSILQAPLPLWAQPDHNPEQRLKELGLTLPAPVRPVANFVTAVRTGNLVFLAGHGPCGEATEKVKGKVGKDRTIEEGYEAARQTALCLLATLKAEIGDLSKVKRIVRVFGMVNATDTFDQHPKVINGCSDLLVEVFGEHGKHARAAVGMASLPFNWTVEIEMVVEVAEP
jgi:enamine deaminase RidA (YjgF/YER057c/UK114 family)